MPTMPHLRAPYRVPTARFRGLRTPQERRATASSVVDCAVYVDGLRRPGDCTYGEAIRRVRRDGAGFVWIGLNEPTGVELAGIADRFGLHPLAVEDAVHAHQRPKVERYEDMLFAVLKTVRYVSTEQSTGDGDVVETGEVMVFLGQDFVITVRHGRHGSLRGVRHIMEGDPGRLRRGPSAVLHAVMDQVVDGYLAVCDALQEDVDAVETAVFSGPSHSRDAEQIYVLKREVLQLRRAVTPLAAPLRSLGESPSPLVAPEVQQYIRDVDDHLTRVTEQIASFDELLTTIVHANLAQVAVEQNEEMRRISARMAILAVPTAIAAVYGMNFEYMPELHWRYGYAVIMAITGVICLMLYRGFRRNGWL